jgi:hypothetical protein
VKFIDRALVELEAAGVVAEFPETERALLDDGSPCSGYFDDRVPKLVVATGRHHDRWAPVLVHEFCHFLQWRDDREFFDSCKFDGKDGIDVFLEHVSGERYLTPTEIVRVCLLSAEVEHDCESRVLGMIAEHGLPMDPRQYAKMANSYVAYYHAMPELGDWCRGERPYEVQEILDIMPDHLDLDTVDYLDLAVRAMDLYRTRCLSPAS